MEESKYFNGNSMVNNLKETPFFCSPADSFYRPLGVYDAIHKDLERSHMSLKIYGTKQFFK
jgi:hypothetical protein